MQRRHFVPMFAAGIAGRLAAAEDFRPYTEAPRLLLNARRRKLLQRERERQSMRWERLDALIGARTAFPEPGFVQALHYGATGKEDSGRAAVDWALAGASDIRQLAMVFDWCRPLLDGPRASTLAARLRQGIEAGSAPASAGDARTRAFAALAIADQFPAVAEKALSSIVRDWWRGQTAPALERGEPAIARRDLYPLLELMHAVRDNLQIDLREDAPGFFRHISLGSLMSYYPAPLAEADGEYRIPAAPSGEPDVALATFARLADFALVAYDPNALENQYVQGWLMHDRYNLRSPLGAPYEFLWANPYQPGLSYYNLPGWFHDPVAGRAFLRSSWDDDATWLGFFEGHVQTFRDGSPRMARLDSLRTPLQMGGAVVLLPKDLPKFRMAAPVRNALVVGVEPAAKYTVEIEGEPKHQAEADRGGILEIAVEDKYEGEVKVTPVKKPRAS